MKIHWLILMAILSGGLLWVGLYYPSLGEPDQSQAMATAKLLRPKSAAVNLYLTDAEAADIARVEVAIEETQIKGENGGFQTITADGAPAVLEPGVAQKIGSAKLEPDKYVAVKLKLGEEAYIIFKNGSSSSAKIIAPIVLANFSESVAENQTLSILIDLDLRGTMKTVNGVGGEVSFVFEPPTALAASAATKAGIKVTAETGTVFKKPPPRETGVNKSPRTDRDALKTAPADAAGSITLEEILELEQSLRKQ